MRKGTVFSFVISKEVLLRNLRQIKISPSRYTGQAVPRRNDSYPEL